MKTTGVIRKLDELGRITLPIELRRSLDLDVKDGLEITVQDDCITVSYTHLAVVGLARIAQYAGYGRDIDDPPCLLL